MPPHVVEHCAVPNGAEAVSANGRRERGQVLVLFAGGIIGFIALVALAIDISMVYSLQRTERSAADSAALAGAQDMQQQGSRGVTDVQRNRARCHALENLAGTFKVLAPTCPSPITNSNLVDFELTGTPYWVSIKTPSPSYVNVDRDRAVQVTVRNHDVPLTFARLFGQHDWDVAMTSVAGLDFGRSYAIITLRLPKKLGATFDVKDITLDGGTHVTVQHGDVGSNANMEYSGTGTWLMLDPGYAMYYFDPLSSPLWGGNPVGKKITELIADPNYRYPVMTGAPTWSDARASIAGPGEAVQRADADAACQAEAAKVDKTRYAFMATQSASQIYCYNPGIYDSGNNRAQIVVGTGDVALLKPGAYYLKKGLDVGGRLLGGYEPSAPGVALMFDECLNTCIFSGNNATTIALNAGTKFPPGSAGVSATAAVDWAGQLVQTSGPSSPTPPLLMTLMVNKDPGCIVPTSPPWIEPAACDAGKNRTLNMAGGGSLALEGVQYAPTDNIEIAGGSSGTGQVGQIIAWTLKYSGGTQINQEGPSSEGPGIIHLDAACSGGGTPCAP